MAKYMYLSGLLPSITMCFLYLVYDYDGDGHAVVHGLGHLNFTHSTGSNILTTSKCKTIPVASAWA